MARSLLVWGLDKQGWTAEKEAINEHGGILDFWSSTSTVQSPVIHSCAAAAYCHSVSVDVREASEPAQLCRLHR